MTGPMPVLTDQTARAGRTWPAYLFGGRLRTSTLALIIAFIAIWWLYATYQPAVHPREQVPATEVVPPGFVPDPSYTWVPRTDVQRQVPTTTPTTTTSPETPTTTATTTEATSGPGTSGQPTTTGPSAPEPSAASSAPGSTPSSTSAQSPTAASTSTAVPLPPLIHPTALPSTPTPAASTP